MKLSFRSLHRDLGYFYIGLIITFSVSGLFLNHREAWHPMKYEFETKDIKIPKELLTQEPNNNTIQEIYDILNVDDKISGYGIHKDLLWISSDFTNIEINTVSGEGMLRQFRITPVLGHFTQLHIETSSLWIYYSDVFAISLLFIAVSAMIFPKGKYGFKKRGWKLMIAGFIFPIISLIILS